jgi:hypothetical protein
LGDLHQCESTLEAGQTIVIEHGELQLPTFTRASQNVVMVVALLHILPIPSTDGMGKVY